MKIATSHTLLAARKSTHAYTAVVGVLVDRSTYRVRCILLYEYYAAVAQLGRPACVHTHTQKTEDIQCVR